MRSRNDDRLAAPSHLVYVYFIPTSCENVASPFIIKEIPSRRVGLFGLDADQVAMFPRASGKNDEGAPRLWSVGRTPASPPYSPSISSSQPFLPPSPPRSKAATMADHSHQHTSLPPTDTINAFSQSGDDEEEIDQLDSDSDQDEQVPAPSSTKRSRRRSGERLPGQPLLPASKLTEILKTDGAVPVPTKWRLSLLILRAV